MKKLIYVLIFISITLYPKGQNLTHKMEFKRSDSHFAQHNVIQPGRIIFITGSCSAGKSSLTKLVAQQLHAKTFAFDEYVIPKVLNNLMEQYVGKLFASFFTTILMRNFLPSLTFSVRKQNMRFKKNFMMN